MTIIQPPQRNLPPDASQWAKWVEQKLSDLARTQNTTGQQLAQSNAGYRRLYSNVVDLHEVVEENREITESSQDALEGAIEGLHQGSPVPVPPTNIAVTSVPAWGSAGQPAATATVSWVESVVDTDGEKLVDPNNYEVSFNGTIMLTEGVDAGEVDEDAPEKEEVEEGEDTSEVDDEIVEDPEPVDPGDGTGQVGPGEYEIPDISEEPEEPVEDLDDVEEVEDEDEEDEEGEDEEDEDGGLTPNPNQAVVKDLSVNTEFVVRVRAVTPAGEVSEWSAPVVFTTADNPPLLDAPSKPILHSTNGELDVMWDGLLGGKAAPQHLDYVAVETRLQGTSAWTRFAQDAGWMTVGLTVGDVWEVRLVAVDTLGRDSAPSAVESITIVSAVQDALDHANQVASDLEEEKDRVNAELAPVKGDLATLKDTTIPALTTTLEVASTAADAAGAEAAQARADAEAAILAASNAATSAADALSAAVDASGVAGVAKSDAANAQAAADQAAADLATLAGKTGRVIVQESAPTGANADKNNLWIKKSTGQPHEYTGSDWVLITDSRLTAAAASADQAQNLAGAAQERADLAKDLADAAKLLADAAQADLDNLQIGGRNYLKKLPDQTNNNVFRDITVADGVVSWTQKIAGTSGLTLATYMDDEPEIYTLSFKTDDPSYIRAFLNSYSSGTVSTTKKVEDRGSYYLVSLTTQRPFGPNNTDKGINFYGTDPYTPEETVLMWDFKLEKGNKATDWTPAPEDVDAAVTAVDNKAIAAQAAATAAGSSAASAQSKADTAFANAATAQSTANTARSEASSAQSKADTAASDLLALAGKSGRLIRSAAAPTAADDKNVNNLWLNTGNGQLSQWTGSAWTLITDSRLTAATNAAATAQSTADTAKTNAATAQAKADQAFTNAATAKTSADNAMATALGAQAAADTADGKATTANGRITIATANPTATDAVGKPIGAVWEVRSGGTVLRKYVLTAATTWTQVKAGQDFIGEKAIGQAQIGDAAIGTLQVADAAITNAKIGSVSAAKIDAALGTFTAATINSLTSETAFINSLVAQKVVVAGNPANKVGSALIENGAVTAPHITASQALSAKVAQFLEVKTGSIVWDNAAGNRAFIGSLVGDQAFLQQVYANRIVVDGRDYAPGPGGYQSVYDLGANTSFSASASDPTGRALRIDPRGATVASRSAYGPQLPVTPGSSIFVGVHKTYVGTGDNARFQLRFFFYDVDGVQVDNPLVYDPGATNIPATVRIEETVEVPATAVTGRICFYAYALDTPRTVWFRNFTVRAQTGAVLIEEGAITAPKMQAGALDSFEITSPIFQSVKTANRGIKWIGDTITGYTNTGAKGFELVGGAATISGGTISGGTFNQVDPLDPTKSMIKISNGTISAERHEISPTSGKLQLFEKMDIFAYPHVYISMKEYGEWGYESTLNSKALFLKDIVHNLEINNGGVTLHSSVGVGADEVSRSWWNILTNHVGSLNGKSIWAGDPLNLAPDLGSNPEAWRLGSSCKAVFTTASTTGVQLEIQGSGSIASRQAWGPMVPVQEGDLISFSMRFSFYSANPPSNDVWASIYWYDGQGNELDPNREHLAVRSSSGVVKNITVAPNKAAYARIAVYALNGSGAWSIREMDVRRIPPSNNVEGRINLGSIECKTASGSVFRSAATPVPIGIVPPSGYAWQLVAQNSGGGSWAMASASSTTANPTIRFFNSVSTTLNNAYVDYSLIKTS